MWPKLWPHKKGRETKNREFGKGNGETKRETVHYNRRERIPNVPSRDQERVPTRPSERSPRTEAEVLSNALKVAKETPDVRLEEHVNWMETVERAILQELTRRLKRAEARYAQYAAIRV